MNNYCVDLNFGIELLKNKDIEKHYLEQKNSQTILTNVDVFNNEFLKFLDGHNLYIFFSECFYTPAFNIIGPIHTDCFVKGDHIKINWAYYQHEEARMQWFKPLTEGEKRYTPANTFYIKHEKHEVELVHSAKVGFPSIVQVGVPHGIEAGPSERLCFSILPAYKGTKTKLTMSSAVDIFKQYIGGAHW